MDGVFGSDRPQDGHPIFDLRQTLSGAWLDGAPIAVSSLAQHDFGGGPQAELRVVQSSLTAGSAHTLRVTYSLGIPQASAAGSYQPNIAWSAGPRLVFNFGFTDLGPGRYLEAWVPANLIFDQFTVDLEASLLNTAIAHSVITNAQIMEARRQSLATALARHQQRTIDFAGGARHG